MKKLISILILLFPVFLWGADVVNFGSDTPGAVPKGWSVFMTHQGGAPKWEVVADRTAPSKKGNVVGQTSKDQTDGRFPLLIYDNSILKDGDLSVAFKAIKGLNRTTMETRAPAWYGATRTQITITSPEPTRSKTTSCYTRSKKASAFRCRPWGSLPTPMDSRTTFPPGFGIPFGSRSTVLFSPFTSMGRRCSMSMTRHSPTPAKWASGRSRTALSISTILLSNRKKDCQPRGENR